MKKIISNTYFRAVVIILITTTIFALFSMIFIYIDKYLTVPDSEFIDPSFKDAEKFIKYGYPEIKTLSIQFLTLLTAILIFSLTFSEKIVNYNQSKKSIRIILVAGWTLLIMAIISDGIGLAFNAFALPTALADLNYYEKNLSASVDFYEPAFFSLKSILISGVFFIGGLICIVSSGVASIIYTVKSNDEIRKL